jgi:hypothetical protein
MSVTLKTQDLDRTLERAYAKSIGKDKLPSVWIERCEQLDSSPSVAAIAAFGAALLAKATDPAIDALVIQLKDGGPGAFNLRAPATVLAKRKREFGIDIGSSSDRDPINAGTFVSESNWRNAHDRIRKDHKPFFQLILRWLSDVNKLDQDEALDALAAYLRVRSVGNLKRTATIPEELGSAPSLEDLVSALDGFVAAHPQGGASGMALVAAVYRAAGYEVDLPSRNDPRRIDVRINRGGTMRIACEVKQVPTSEPTAQSLAEDASDAQVAIGLLVVLRPGTLEDFDRASVVREAAHQHSVVLRVTSGARELVHEGIVSGTADTESVRQRLPRLFAEALAEASVDSNTADAWAALAGAWID